eukprot:3205315-Rhodomonas_salina.2
MLYAYFHAIASTGAEHGGTCMWIPPQVLTRVYRGCTAGLCAGIQQAASHTQVCRLLRAGQGPVLT